MGEQLEFTVEHKCDKCGKFKPRPFSYFTSRFWMCQDCKQESLDSIKSDAKRVEKYLLRESCESFQELVNLNRKFHEDD